MEGRRLANRRTIFNEHQQRWLIENAHVYNKKQLCYILNTDMLGVRRLARRINLDLPPRVTARRSLDDMIIAKNHIDALDNIEVQIEDEQNLRRQKEIARQIVITELIREAEKHDPGEIQERLPMSGMTITWGEYVKRLMVWKDGLR